MTQTDQAAAVQAAYQQTTAGLREQLKDYLLALWASLGYYGSAQLPDFLDQALPTVQGAMAQMQAATAAHLATQAALRGGTATPAAFGALTTGTVRNGANPAEVYGRPFHLVWRQIGQAKQAGQVSDQAVSKAVEAGANRAVQLAMTDLQLAKTHTAQEVLSTTNGSPEYHRVLEGAHSCALCIVASTMRYHRKQLMPIHPGCVTGRSVVQASGIHAVSRRWYSGELAIVTTAAGDEVAVTANHPVLTDRGWVPAHMLRIGDDLFRSGERHRVVDGVPQEAQRPALAQDVWRSAAVSGLLLRVPLASEDFHADGAEGEVEIVYTDRYFASVGNAALTQPVGEGSFRGGHRGRVLLPGGGVPGSGVEGLHSATVRSMGGGDLSEALGGAHLLGPVEPGSGTTPRFDAPAQQFTLQSAPVYAERGLQLVRRLSGEVERDRVVELRHVGWRDHVYNLHTDEGWYSSNNHIVSNCDCGIEEVEPGQPHRVDEKRLADAHAAIVSQFGASSPSARGIPDAGGVKYSDVLIVHDHGELGPVLAVRGRPFTGPNDLH